MPHTPMLIGAAAAAAALTWAAHLALDPDPFAGGPAAVLAVSLAVAAVVAVTATLIARARWARWMIGGVALAGLGLASITPVDPVAITGLALSGLALTGAAGPWLASWLRRLPAAEAPPPAAVVAVAAPSLLPAYVALARFEGLGTLDWVTISVAASAAIGVSRAAPWGLWTVRLAVPAAAIAAGVAAGRSDGVILGLLIAAAGVAAAAPAWLRDAGLSVTPILPSPGNVPIPPELVDPAMLEAAGYDDRGRSTGGAR